MTESNGTIDKIYYKTSKFLDGYICQSLEDMAYKKKFNEKIIDGILETVKNGTEKKPGKDLVQDLIKKSSDNFKSFFDINNYEFIITNAILDGYQKKMPEIISAYKKMEPTTKGGNKTRNIYTTPHKKCHRNNTTTKRRQRLANVS